MARLPIPGQDDDNWGSILNNYLLVEHHNDGTQRTLRMSRGGTGATSASGALNNLGAVRLKPSTSTQNVIESTYNVTLLTLKQSASQARSSLRLQTSSGANLWKIRENGGMDHGPVLNPYQGWTGYQSDLGVGDPSSLNPPAVWIHPTIKPSAVPAPFEGSAPNFGAGSFIYTPMFDTSSLPANTVDFLNTPSVNFNHRVKTRVGDSMDHVGGVYSQPMSLAATANQYTDPSGTLENVYNFRGGGTFFTGSITQFKGFYLTAPYIDANANANQVFYFLGGTPPSGTGTVNELYGMYLNNLTGRATTTYAIKTLGGEVFHAAGNAAAKAMVLQGASSQTADLQQWQDANSNTLLSVLASGDMQFGEGRSIVAGTATGLKIGTATNQRLGFYNSTPVVKPTVSGAKGGNAALTSLISALSSLGLIADSTS